MAEDERILIDPAPTQGFLQGVTFPILGIEVTQAIQDLKNSVTLIAGKATMVRVYLDQSPIAATSPFVVPIPITGELAVRREDGAQGMVSATVNLRPAIHLDVHYF